MTASSKSNDAILHRCSIVLRLVVAQRTATEMQLATETLSKWQPLVSALRSPHRVTAGSADLSPTDQSPTYH